MKINSFLIAIFTASFSIAQTPCTGGMAGSFPCEGYDLISHISLSTMNSTRANDSWGWTDPQDGKEYAIVCLIEGTAFIDISDPVNPVYLGKLPTQNNSSTWRDAKTYNNFAFIVSEDPGHGMQVFDLTRLRDVINPPVLFTEDTHYSGFGGAHNVVINEDTGYAYAVGSNVNNGGPHFINIQDPMNPIGEGGYSTEGYCHDAQAVVYNGPDTEYLGSEILIASNEDRVAIIDVTDKANPQTISTITYPNTEYTHQGWLTENHSYFLLGDEADEINLGLNTRTIVFDITDLDNPQYHFEYSGPFSATDHNGYVKGDYFYLSNNAAGLRVIDISDIANQNMNEVGYFDSFIPNNNSGYNGAWSVYPYFESGNIVISDRTEGFLLTRSSLLSINDFIVTSPFVVTPNPADAFITIHSKNESISSVAITDIIGNLVYSSNGLPEKMVKIQLSHLSNGLYFVVINEKDVKKIIKR